MSKCIFLSIFLICGILAAVTQSACTGLSTNHPEVAPKALSAEMVLQTSPLAGELVQQDFSQVKLLEMSPEMTAFVSEHVDRKASQSQRLAQLVYAVISEDRFLLAYDDSTRTAASTFHDRRGNCISFTNMFVAMARDLGLDASYQEVTIPPDWSIEGEMLLLSQHVNVLVGLKSARSRVVDFNSFRDNLPDASRVISDQRARAHYFNNIGVERMLADETSLAFANLRESLRNDQTFSPAWINLGTLHRREGYPDYAETAYLEALEHDTSNLIAMSNLANLYEEQGKRELAELYLSKVQSHRMRNPFYRYQLANTAFIEGDYKTAIQNLKYAIQKRKDEDRFYFLLSLCYLMSGDT